MAKIANVAVTTTFDTWRTNSNISFDRLSQFAVNNSSLYANTITANAAFTSTGLATMSGRATVGTNLTVSGNTTLGAAGKTITTTGAAAHTGTKTISTNLTVSGNTSTNKATVTSSLTVSGNTTLGAAGKTITTTGAAAHTGTKTISTNLTVSGNTAINGSTLSTTSASLTALAGATTLLTLGGTGASAVLAIPSTLEQSSTTGALTVAGGVYIAKKLNVVGVATLGTGAILGTPASGTVTNLTGTASININGTVGATTATTGAFTSLSSTIGANFATSSGNVGIGTNSPNGKLSVLGGAVGAVNFDFGNTTAQAVGAEARLRLQPSTIFSITNPTLSPYISAIQTNAANSASDIAFGSWSGTALIEIMRLQASGNVGIGNSSPAGKLDITQATTNTSAIIVAHSGAGGGSNTNYGAQINVTGASNTNTGVYANAYGAANNYGVRIVNPPASAASWALYSDATAQSYFAGNVGIGTTLPASRLSSNVSGVGSVTALNLTNDNAGFAAGTGPAINFGVASVVQGVFGKLEVLNQTATSGSNSYMAFSTRGSDVLAERMRIDASGNITATSNSVGAKYFQFQNADAGSGSYAANILTSNNGSLQMNISSTAAGGTGSIYYSGTNVLNLYTTTASSLQMGTNNTTTHLVIDSTGNVTKNTATGSLGYGTGAGGTVTQATDKSTAVTLNKPCGTITMNGAALAGSTAVTFTLNNSILAAADTITVNLNSSVANFLNYTIQASAWSAGTVIIKLRNDTAGSLSDAVQFNFAIIKGATS